MQRVMGRKGGEGEGPKTSENKRLSAFRPSLFKCRGTIMCGIWLDMIHYREKMVLCQDLVQVKMRNLSPF